MLPWGNPLAKGRDVDTRGLRKNSRARMTQKEQLDAANATIADLQTKLSTAEGNAQTNKEAAETAQAGEKAAKAEAATAKEQFEAESKAHAETKKTLAAVEAERDQLKATDKSAAAKSAEQLARMGIKPAAKDTPEQLAEGVKDGEAIYAEYQRLMSEGKSLAASQYWTKHEKDLEAYAASEAAKL